MAKKNLHKVLTSLPVQINLGRDVVVTSYRNSPYYGWAREMLLDRNTRRPIVSDAVFERLARQFRRTIYRNVYFRIDDKNFFADFYVVKDNVAIIVGGATPSSDFERRCNVQRDSYFKSVGIEVVNCTCEEINREDFFRGVYAFRVADLGIDTIPVPGSVHRRKNIMKAITALKLTRENTVLEMQSDNYKFLQDVSRRFLKEGTDDSDILSEFFDVRRKRGITVVGRYVGDMDVLDGNQRRWVIWSAEKCDAAPFRSVLDLSFKSTDKAVGPPEGESA